MTGPEGDALLARCTEVLRAGRPPSKGRARELFRLGVLVARHAYKECQEVGLDPDAEYSDAVDEAEALERSLLGGP